MPVKIPTLRRLPFVEEDHEILLQVSDFINFMRDRKEDGDKNIRPDNMKVEFARRNHLTIRNGKSYITFQGIILYVTNHINDYKICKTILDEITNILCSRGANKSPSILALYREIAELNILGSFSSFTIDETSIHTLHLDYRPEFSHIDWRKIVRFEYQFQRNNPNPLGYEEALQKKVSFFNSLKQTAEVGRRLHVNCSNLVINNQKRRDAAEVLNSETLIVNDVTHTYDSLEKSIQNLRNLSPTHFKGAATDCVQTVCRDHSFGIHIFIAVKSVEDFQTYEDIAIIVRSTLQKTHGVTVPEVIFVEEDSFMEYSCNSCNDDSIHKFHLRDEYLSRKLCNHILFVSRSLDESYTDLFEPETISHEGSAYCSDCFSCIAENIHRSLDWRKFDLLKEWYIEVPLEFQIILGSIFINKESMRKSDEGESYLYNKISRLYSLLDTGLNILNRNYNGILQHLNTEELIVNYHSISTVFAVTGQSGTTRSLKSATRWLQSRADVDKRYFDSFLKMYPLEYTNKHQETANSKVCMRDCYVILFLDNLVRFSIHADPDPGKNRTSQICTLPITVKGLPRDSSIVDSWHSSSCTGADECNCLDRIELGKQSHDLLLEYTEEEEIALYRLDVQTSLGISLCVSDMGILIKEFLETTDTGIRENCDELIDPMNDVDLEELNKSLQSVIIDNQFQTNLGQLEEERDELDSFNMSMQSLNLNDNANANHAPLSPSSQLKVQDENLIDLNDTDEYLEDILQEDQFMDGIRPLESSFDDADISIEFQSPQSPLTSVENVEDKDENVVSRLNDAISLKMKKFIVPPLLCRHPTPAHGRDDNISHLREILSDILVKLGRYPGVDIRERILFAPDHKISKNLLTLMKTDPTFQQFLPEFPVLHLKKSKITNLFAAYKNAGILHLLKYMKDSDKEADWTDLLSSNIETAARYIKRLCLALHLAFFLKFTSTLTGHDIENLVEDIEKEDLYVLRMKWYNRLNMFIENGKELNATFALHVDLMSHCGEVLGIGMAERIGGHDGYNLLLGCVKSSLPFSFLNGATSYASFCTDLLHEHYSAGIFHQNLKKCLFSTPHKNSGVNFALDTQREMDHQDAIKGFRPRSTLDSVIPRMAIVDHFTDVQKVRSRLNTSDLNTADTTNSEKDDQCCKDKATGSEEVNYTVSEKDLKFIIPVAKLILRVNALSLEKDNTPKNVYDQNMKALSPAILDKESYPAGQFMVRKYACQNNLFNLSKEDIPGLESVKGHTSILQKLKTSKGVTMRRATIKTKQLSNNEKKEAKRVAFVRKQTTIADCLSSDMNACQSLVNADCTKSGLQKSPAIKKALLKLLSLCIPCIQHEQMEAYLESNDIILYDIKEVPTRINRNIKYATVEFAGVKFKTTATSGEEYLKHVQNGVINHLLSRKNFPNLHRIVICEEKYSFTPDDFKAATRQKRQKPTSGSISHLKIGTEILSEYKMSKSAIITTDLGKRLISNYLARNIHNLDVKKDIVLDIDSELFMQNCNIHREENCNCPAYTTPLRGYFSQSGFLRHEMLHNIKQRKGEAEMAQVDWLLDIAKEMTGTDSVVSIVTSADVDSIIIHLFALSYFWPRNEDGSFKNKLYLMLQKQKPELYCITSLLEILEARFGRQNVITLVVTLCIGGNDFLPKFHGISHEKWLLAVIESHEAVKNLISFEVDPVSKRPLSGSVNKNVYYDIVKNLYCPLHLDHTKLNLDTVRQLTVKPPGKEQRHPKLWMPPRTALANVAELINCQIEYLLTVWDHEATLPNFLDKGCLIKDSNGNIKYNFGDDARVESIEKILLLTEDALQKITMPAMKPLKRGPKTKRARSLETTPVKSTQRKKRPMMSTPIKMKSGSSTDDT